MLELDGIGVRYPASGWVLRHVSFACPPGTATAALGPNGRGKTTLLRVAAGLLRPGEGRVLRDGPTGFVPQARSGAFGYSAAEMVLMGRAGLIGPFATPGRRDTAAALEALDQVGVSHLAERAFPTLSGGEQQLVLIARALASRSRTLILDEPAAGLDLGNQGLVLGLLRRLVDDGLSVLLTTHHPDHALYLGATVVLLRGGGRAECGSAADLLTDDDLSDLYGIPVRSVTYPDGARTGRALVPRYPAADPGVSRAPGPDPSARPGG